MFEKNADFYFETELKMCEIERRFLICKKISILDEQCLVM